jgi:hypothetical protein
MTPVFREWLVLMTDDRGQRRVHLMILMLSLLVLVAAWPNARDAVVYAVSDEVPISFRLALVSVWILTSVASVWFGLHGGTHTRTARLSEWLSGPCPSVPVLLLAKLLLWLSHSVVILVLALPALSAARYPLGVDGELFARCLLLLLANAVCLRLFAGLVLSMLEERSSLAHPLVWICAVGFVFWSTGSSPDSSVLVALLNASTGGEPFPFLDPEAREVSVSEVTVATLRFTVVLVIGYTVRVIFEAWRRRRAQP